MMQAMFLLFYRCTYCKGIVSYRLISEIGLSSTTLTNLESYVGGYLPHARTKCGARSKTSSQSCFENFVQVIDPFVI